jgi:hypothetical protein
MLGSKNFEINIYLNTTRTAEFYFHKEFNLNSNKNKLHYMLYAQNKAAVVMQPARRTCEAGLHTQQAVHSVSLQFVKIKINIAEKSIKRVIINK